MAGVQGWDKKGWPLLSWACQPSQCLCPCFPKRAGPGWVRRAARHLGPHSLGPDTAQSPRRGEHTPAPGPYRQSVMHLGVSPLSRQSTRPPPSTPAQGQEARLPQRTQEAPRQQGTLGPQATCSRKPGTSFHALLFTARGFQEPSRIPRASKTRFLPRD